MSRFVVNVDECSLHVRQDFNRVLKLLADIVCFPQGRASLHDDINLDEVVWSTLAYRIL